MNKMYSSYYLIRKMYNAAKIAKSTRIIHVHFFLVVSKKKFCDIN